MSKCLAFGCIAFVALAAALYVAVPRYQIVATTMFNVGGIYKLDTRTGRLWLCEPIAITVDKTVITPAKGCFELNNIAGDNNQPGADL